MILAAEGVPHTAVGGNRRARVTHTEEEEQPHKLAAAGEGQPRRPGAEGEGLHRGKPAAGEGEHMPAAGGTAAAAVAVGAPNAH